MVKPLAVLKEGKAEEAVAKWFSLRADIRRNQNRLGESQEALSLLEQEFLWLGGIKGTLRKNEVKKRLQSSITKLIRANKWASLA
jgi:hypothetical protein